MAVIDPIQPIDPKRIFGVKWNPSRRTDRRCAKFQELLADVRMFGQCIPGLLIRHPDKEGCFVAGDGNRRLEVINVINEDMPIQDRRPFLGIVKDWTMTVLKERYRVINGTQMRHNKLQLMGTWMKDKTAVLPKYADEFGAIVSHVGLDTFMYMEANLKTPNTYNFALRIANPLGMRNDGKTVKQLIHWMIDFKVMGVVQKAAVMGGFEKTLVEAAFGGGTPWFDDNHKMHVEYPGEPTTEQLPDAPDIENDPPTLLMTGNG
jgi:hypothetical protein